MNGLKSISCAALVLTLAGGGKAAECVWTGAAGDGRWSRAANWTVPPAAGQTNVVVIDIGSVARTLTNDLAGISFAQLRLLGSNDVAITISGNVLTLDPPASTIATIALTNHCSLVLDAPLRVGASCTLALYGQRTTFNGNVSIDDGVSLRMRSRASKKEADPSLVGSCAVAFNGRFDGPEAELHVAFGENGRGVTAPFNAPVNVKAFYQGENTRPGTVRFKASGNAIGRFVFASKQVWADVDHAFTTNTVIELGKHPTSSNYCWSDGGLYLAPGTEQIADRLDGRPIVARYGGQQIRVLDDDKAAIATLRLRGTTNAVTYLALADRIGVVWEPTGDFVQDFRDRIHTAYGGLHVARGTLRSSGTNSFVRMRSLIVDAGAAFEAASVNPLGLFPNLNALELGSNAIFRVTDAAATCPQIIGEYASVALAQGARFELPAGVALTLNAVTTNGVPVAGATYTGAANPDPGAAIPVDWIVGAGTAAVAAEPRSRETMTIGVPAGEGGIKASLATVKAFRATDVDTPIELALAPGDHRFNGAQLTLTYDHARNAWASLAIRAADAANPPRLLGGFAVTNVWQKGRFPGRSDVWTADVTALTNASIRPPQDSRSMRADLAVERM